MGDSGTCLMHSFSYTSSAQPPPVQQQGNPMNALGESISFGRFMSESLSWEKWSTFSQNRYVEEAERYAKPGSVAQKKAFFEAHYKRIAAQKAAALLEQANAAAAAANNATESEPDETRIGESETMPLKSHEAVLEEEEPEIIKTEHPKIDLLAKIDDGKNSDNKSVEPVAEEVPMETDLDKQEMNSGSEFSGTPQMEKPLLKSCGDAEEVSSVKSKKKSAFSSLKSSVYRKTSKVPVPTSPAKPITSHMKKENHAATTTPVANKKFAVELPEKRKSTPKFLRTYVNSMPTKEPDKLSATATRTKENPKRSQDCKTPLKTPRMAPSAWMSKLAPATPVSENTRPKSPNDGSKTTGPTPRWHILSAVCSKSLTACRNKLQSPTLSSTPFTLRTEERAARRKQKLEEKFNAKEVQKVQLQTKLKEKAGSEFRKLRQSFCFKARPLPDFYKERGEATKIQTKKSSVTQPQSPKLGKKPNSRTIPLPSSISKYKSSNISKHVFNKNGQNTNNCFASVPEMINHENTSPNIQY